MKFFNTIFIITLIFLNVKSNAQKVETFFEFENSNIGFIQRFLLPVDMCIIHGNEMLICVQAQDPVNSTIYPGLLKLNSDGDFISSLLIDNRDYKSFPVSIKYEDSLCIYAVPRPGDVLNCTELISVAENFSLVKIQPKEIGRGFFQKLHFLKILYVVIL